MELLGMIRMSANDTAGAKRLFEQAVYLEPTRSASLLQLALISERSGDARRAATYWDRARRAPADAGQERRA
jgi:cytochrome c-type biogenesis protein CcmH/NrfG